MSLIVYHRLGDEVEGSGTRTFLRAEYLWENLFIENKITFPCFYGLMQCFKTFSFNYSWLSNKANIKFVSFTFNNISNPRHVFYPASVREHDLNRCILFQQWNYQFDLDLQLNKLKQTLNVGKPQPLPSNSAGGVIWHISCPYLACGGHMFNRVFFMLSFVIHLVNSLP